MIVWEGASRYDHRPIVVIVTGAYGRPSVNGKTGRMAQAWILRTDTHPSEAVASGEDRSICGECPLRPSKRGGCYVRVSQAPASIYRAYLRGRYRRVGAWSANRIIKAGVDALRIGAYGDPAAVPESIWWQLTHGIKTVTGYTHGATMSDAAGRDFVSEISPYAMVSVESADDASHVASRGYRYFRVGAPGEMPGPGEVRCPASSEARAETGREITCASCGLCDGMRRAAVRLLPNVFINAHGVRAGRIGGVE